MTPPEASNKENERYVYLKLYGDIGTVTIRHQILKEELASTLTIISKVNVTSQLRYKIFSKEEARTNIDHTKQKTVKENYALLR